MSITKLVFFILMPLTMLPAIPALAAADAEKASVRTETRDLGRARTAEIKTWKLRGGTRISTEVLRENGAKYGYTRTVTRTNGDSRTVHVDRSDPKLGYTVTSGKLGNASLMNWVGNDGERILVASNDQGRASYARFSGPHGEPEVHKKKKQR